MSLTQNMDSSTTANGAGPKSVLEHALAYVELGWGLCRIPPGSKGPNYADWNKPGLYINTPEAARQAFSDPSTKYGLGLIHAASGTCAIDVDHLEFFAAAMAEFGFTVDELFAGAPRIAGAPGHDKAIFRMPAGVPPATHKLVWPAQVTGGKPVTIFELRAGDVQDVLPPTIHPVTEAAYAWRIPPWALTDIPELPKPLAEMWKAWSNLQPQLMAACPWNVAQHASPPPRPAPVRDHQNVIGKWNSAHPLREALKHYGYKQCGKRFLAPTSSSGLAGVILFEGDEHFFSHHASDPLNDGKRHDAFDLFAHFEHNNDQRAAIKAAARELGVERERTPLVTIGGRLAGNAKVARAAKPKEQDPPPAELLEPPGILREIMQYDLDNAPKPQPHLAVQGALALAGVVLARKYATDHDNHPSLYFVNIADSGAGKDHARKVIQTILAEAKLEGLLNSGYASAQGVISRCIQSPAHITLTDEFGRWLESAKRSSAQHKTDALSQIMEAFNNTFISDTARSTSGMTPREASEASRRIVHLPNITMLAVTTPDAFFEALNERSVSDGFLGRFLIAISQEPLQVTQHKPRRAVPASIIEWIYKVRQREGGNLTPYVQTPADTPPKLLRLCIQTLALDAKLAFEKRINKFIEEQKLREDGLLPLLARSAEKALRLALICALAEDPDAPTVELEHMRWAISYVEYYDIELVRNVREKVGSEESRLRNKVRDWIIGRGEFGATRDQLARLSPYRNVPGSYRKAFVEALLESGEVVQVRRKGSRGPSGDIFISREWIAQEELDLAASTSGEDSSKDETTRNYSQPDCEQFPKDKSSGNKSESADT